jgi:hypothetical protein
MFFEDPDGVASRVDASPSGHQGPRTAVTSSDPEGLLDRTRLGLDGLHDWRVAARDACAAVPDTAIGLIGMIRWHGHYLLTSGSLISS